MKQEEELKGKNSILKALQANKEILQKNTVKLPNSTIYSKLELPILYSNLITIEDMKFENSNYFIRSNGFLSSNITLSSLKYDSHFNISDCVFRIFPKTYNINKYKVLDFIQNKSSSVSELNEEEINFKFESEMFNNLDIVESKFGEPVRYGDIIMLLHESSQKFIKFNPTLKKLVLSNHDSEYTLFSVEPYCDIMLNDDQVLKSGQPIKLKIASFIYADQNLYFSLHFPYEESADNKTESERRSVHRNISRLDIDTEKDNATFDLMHDGEVDIDASKCESNSEEEKEIFDEQNKKYIKEPELIVEEESNMRWRFNLYSTFTIDENLLVYDNFVNILHCDSNACLTVENIEILSPGLDKNLQKSPTVQSRYSLSKNRKVSDDEISNNPIGANANESIIELDRNEDLLENNYFITSKFFLKKFNLRDMTIDVNATWILENIFSSVKNICFIRFYEANKLDTYRMAFRIKNFKTGKYLSIRKVDQNYFEEGENDFFTKVGLLNDEKTNAVYKFGLVDECSKSPAEMEDYMLSEEYQYSIFGFHPSSKSTHIGETISGSTFRAEKNQFLRIYHVVTKSYLKIIYVDDKKQTDDYLLKCILTLTQHEEQQEVFKICSIDAAVAWKFRFLNNLFYLFKSITNHVNEKVREDIGVKKEKEQNLLFMDKKDEEISSHKSPNTEPFSSVKYKILKTTNFILEKLYKFITNQFINKFSSNYDYKSVVYERQNLIAKFGFTKLILKDFIYDFWIEYNNMSNLKALHEIIRSKNGTEEEKFADFKREEKLIYKMYKYTDSLFQFLILYCKDNNDIKDELYQYLHVFFYFVNLKESCVYCLIEIFKDNSKLLHSLIRDCKNNPNFRQALVNIDKISFLKKLNAQDLLLKKQMKMDKRVSLKIEVPEPEEGRGMLRQKSDSLNDLGIDENMNLIDLIFEYIKISKFEKNPNYNNENLLKRYLKDTCAISLISRDKYFELLKSLVYVKNGNNILENQRAIIEKMLINAKDTEDDYSLVGFLEKKKDQSDYPPCLSELLVSVADENPDPNIQRFLKLNFKLDRLFSNSNSTNNLISTSSASGVLENNPDQEQLAVNLKLISFFIISAANSKFQYPEEYKVFSASVLTFFKKLISKLEKNFDIDVNSISKFNYSDKSEVNALNSAIQFIKTVYQNDMRFQENSNHSRKPEKKLISNLMYFITHSYYIVNENKKFSSVLQEQMNKKQMTLRDRIVKSNHNNYLCIAKSWLNVYLVFKNKLSKSIDEEENRAYFTTYRITRGKPINAGQDKLKPFPTTKKTRRREGSTNVSRKTSINNCPLSNTVTSQKPKASLSLYQNKDDEGEKHRVSTKKGKKIIYKTPVHMSYNQDDLVERNPEKDNVFSLFQNNQNFDYKKVQFYTTEELDENKKRWNEEKPLTEEDKAADDEIKHDTTVDFHPNFSRTAMGKSFRNKHTTGMINEDPVMRMKSTQHMKKGFTGVKSYQLDYEFHTKNENFIEDERRRNKNEVMKNILNLFELFLKKNVNIMTMNFVDYYKNNFEISESSFDDFLKKCVPRLEIAEIYKYIREYSSIENELVKRKKCPWTQNLTDLNALFDNKNDNKLSFIHSLMIAFNISDELEIQENILHLIYKYFSQRKKFFKRIMLFNDHLITTQYKARNLLLIDEKNSLKSNFLKFFNSYEKNKHTYTDEDLSETIKFFSSLQGDICVLFRRVLINIKHELKTLSNERINKIFDSRDENDSLIEETDKFIAMMNQIEASTQSKDSGYTYEEMFNDIIKFFYFIRRNSSNSIVGSISMILNQDHNNFNQFNFSLFNDFLEKGKKLKKKLAETNKINSKSNYNAEKDTLKKKYYYCFTMLVVLLQISIPRNKKSISFLNNVVVSYRDLLNQDANTSFILLLSLSDLQKENFNLNYYSIMEYVKQFNSALPEGHRSVTETFSNGFTNIYMDIMQNILKYIIEKDKIIAEVNLDEIIVDNLVFLMKKTDQTYYKSEDVFRLISVLKIVLGVECLCKILKIKIENPENEPSEVDLLTKFPKPEDTLELFKFYIIQGYGEDAQVGNFSYTQRSGEKLIQSLKNAFTIYKYILYYLSEINPSYFSNSELKPNRAEVDLVRELIQCVFFGYAYFKEEGKHGMEDSLITNDYCFQFSPEKDFYEILIDSDFFVILNVFSNNFIKFGFKPLKFMDINRDLSFANLTKVTSNFINKIESRNTIRNFTKSLSVRSRLFFIRTDNHKKLFDKFNLLFFIVKKLEKFSRKYEFFENFTEIIHKKKQIIKKEIKEIKNFKKDKCQIFKEMMWQNRKKIISIGNSEANSLIYYFLYLLESENDKKYEDILYTFLTKIIDFIHKSTIYKCSSRKVKINNFFHFIIKQFISFFDGKSEMELNFLRKKSLKEIQIAFERTSIIKNFLQLICNYSSSAVQDQLPFIFETFCMLLMKGNDTWQETFYKNFAMNNEYEHVFKYIHTMVTNKMDSIITNKLNIIRNKKKKLHVHNLQFKFFNEEGMNKLDSKILQFLQLLCENHNRKLQLFLHHQANFRKSYDLITMTNIYLQVLYLHFEKHLFDPLVKCLDLLIEFIQGPCLENQVAMINSKLLITISDILNMYLLTDDIGNRIIAIPNELSVKNTGVISKLSPMQNALLTYKCSILLLALVEARRKDDRIYDQILLNIKPELIKAVYEKIYFQHMNNMLNSNDEHHFVIRMRDLNKAEQIADFIKESNKDDNNSNQTDVDKYLILETGFNLYFLNLYFRDYLTSNLKEHHILKKAKSPFSLWQDRNIVYLFIFFLRDELITIAKFLSLFISGFAFLFSFGRCRVFNLITRIFRKRKLRIQDAFTFYERSTKCIEILRDDEVYKIYFFMYPFLGRFNHFEKNSFLEGMDRTNSKTKLMDILKFSNKLKYELEYDYKVKRFLNNIPSVGVIFKHIELWKDLSLWLTLFQNFFNIAAYYKVENDTNVCFNQDECFTVTEWTDTKNYFNLPNGDFQSIVNKLAILQMSLASVIVLEFFSRKTPSIVKQIEEELSYFNYGPTRRKIFYFKEFILRTFFNFEVIYYLGYITAAVLGFITVDFFFAFLLLEVVTRFKTLKNVVMAIRNPIKELFLTMLLWIILIYYFAIIGYSFFRNDFRYEDDCISLARCTATIFYESNKYDNGIGGYLKNVTVGIDNKVPIQGRFWYDQLFNLIVKILIVQMVAGIIIDNFAKLRKEEMEMITDMNNVCTICGLKKEDIEKVYDKYGRTYEDHIKKDHNIFNYIYYIIFLHKKDKTEFTGMESYVHEMVFRQKDITWFPFNKMYIVSAEDLEGMFDKINNLKKLDIA